jgi:hypothetical protein
MHIIQPETVRRLLRPHRRQRYRARNSIVIVRNAEADSVDEVILCRGSRSAGVLPFRFARKTVGTAGKVFQPCTELNCSRPQDRVNRQCIFDI